MQKNKLENLITAYVFYESVNGTDKDRTMIARLRGNVFSGEKAETIEKLLREQVYAKIIPTQIMRGRNLYALRQVRLPEQQLELWKRGRDKTHDP